MTHYRALGYVDRTAIRDGAPLRVVMASEGPQADGIDLRMSGANLDRFRSNPVLGYGHMYWGRDNLPIGRVIASTIKVEGDQVVGDLEFDQGDEFAREVERKMRDGYLSAVSIGFAVEEWEDSRSNYWTGGVAVKWELSELSVVPIGMDAKALVTAGRGLRLDLAGDNLTVESLLSALREHVRTVPPEEPPPAVEEPARDDLDQTAARALLAAFTPKEGNSE